MNRTHPFTKKRVALSVVIIAGAGLVVFAGFGAWDYFKTTQTGDTVPGSETISYSIDSPSEKQPNKVNEAYKVSDDQPRTIQIPSLNVDTYVQKVGIDQHGALAAPNNIFFAGWYTKGAVPGAEGLSVIDGHAGGRYSDGIFKNLHSLKPQDAIKVQMGDLSWREFAVVKVSTYALQDAAQALFAPDNTIKKELRLITCDGQFDDRTQTYDKRTIVTATPL